MNRQSGFKIMKRLIVEVKPLIPIMLITIFMGVIGFLAAISVPSFGAVAVAASIGEVSFITVKGAIIVMIILAVLRGIFRYFEQLSGHYIAFKILVILRDRVFTTLRRLAPARLEGKEKGNLISLITSDIEMLEVFYAHTIAPIVIGFITSVVIASVLFFINPWFGVLSTILYIIIGFFIPYISSSIGKKSGKEYREIFGKSTSYILESLRGLEEVIQFKNGNKRLLEINKNSNRLNKKLSKIKYHEGLIRALTDLTIMIGVVGFLLIGILLYSRGIINFGQVIIAVVLLASSFGPVVALSNLSNNLLHTFASADRIFSLLDEKEEVKEVAGENKLNIEKIEYKNVSFGYGNREDILEDASIEIKKGDKVAILGESGIGKSTFIKLLMRFFDVKNGEILVDKKNIKSIPTKSLRHAETLVSQETYLFNDTIKNNILIGNEKASFEEVVEAAKKASIHEFIETLHNKYDTKIGEMGDMLSSGEKQRIGLSRAFIKNSDVLILDEPTSNLDTLNEGKIIKAINENCKNQTIILISHRRSTTSICSKIYRLKNKKLING